MIAVHRAMMVLCVAGVVLFLLVRVEKTEADGEKAERLTVGLWFSSWMVRERVEKAGAGFRFSQRLTLLSWSWLCLLPAVLYSSRQVRSEPTGKPPGSDDPAEGSP